MTIELTSDLQQIVDQLVASGSYETEEAVVRTALEELARREGEVAAIREGLEDVQTGRLMSVDESEQRIRRQLGVESST